MRLASYHTPVLREEVLTWLITTTGGVYVDATLGGGGHAESILQRLDPTGMLVGFDADSDAIQFSAARLESFGKRALLVRDNFCNLSDALAQREIHSIRGILFDLGVSSHQFDEPSRGFSFRSDEPLDMRMDQTQAVDACSIVNEYGEQELAQIFYQYGEERAARSIARSIVRRRPETRIETTGELAAIVREVIGDRFLIKSLARIFQALRIVVNNELENLSAALRQALSLLESDGRLIVISYHSLEDRIVKEMFKREAATIQPSGHKFIPDTMLQPTLRILTKKPVEASLEENKSNPRSRSAKMRVAQKV